MNPDPNISVELTDSNELHCFKVTFRAGHPELAEGERVPVEIMLHTRQAFDLFHKLCGTQLVLLCQSKIVPSTEVRQQIPQLLRA